ETITWSGEFRPPLHDADILPQPKEGSLPVWRAVGGPPASAIKAGGMGTPMILTPLGGPAMNFQVAVDAYRHNLTEAGYNAATFPIGTTSLFYVADTTKEALQGMYPHLNAGFQNINGTSYPKQQFAQSPDTRNALMVGDKEQIIEKLLYQYELYGMQRFLAQLDLGGVPLDKLMKNIDIIGNDILPAIKKHTKQ